MDASSRETNATRRLLERRTHRNSRRGARARLLRRVGRQVSLCSLTLDPNRLQMLQEVRAAPFILVCNSLYGILGYLLVLHQLHLHSRLLLLLLHLKLHLLVLQLLQELLPLL